MFLNKDICLVPFDHGIAGRADRSSVNVDLCNTGEIFTLVSAPRQALTRSGFPAGRFGLFPKKQAVLRSVTIALATESGFAAAVVKFIDAAFRPRAERLCLVRIPEKRECENGSAP